MNKNSKKYIEEVESRNTELETIIDDMSDHIQKAESKLDHLNRAFKSYYDNYQEMKEFINDLADHGVRFDTRPTMTDITEDSMPYIKEHYDYIQRIDRSIRQRATVVKNDVEIIEEENGL